MTDLADTGFGRVGKEIVSRFAQTGLYNVVYVGWVGSQSAELHREWQQWGVIIETCQQAMNDQFGQATFPHCVQKYQPDVVWTLGDPWMVEHVPRAPGFGKDWKWISYVPIDRDVLNSTWLPSMKAPDALVLYSKFGQEVVKKHLPRVVTEVIYHGVDTDTFRPIDKNQAKRSLGLDPNTFLIGFVGRNQIRKRIPRLLRAFYFWNCLRYTEDQEIRDGDTIYNARTLAKRLYHRPEKWHDHFRQNPKKANSAVYLHTTQGYTDQNDGLWVGWHIDEYSTRYGLDDNIFNKPSRVMIPDPNLMATVSGLPDEALNTVYNAIDVHVLPSCREGFGLPIIEAASCGVPSIVTDYSSMSELVADGRGFTVPASDFDDEPFWDAPSALVDIDGLVGAFDMFVAKSNSGELQQMSQACRQFAVDHTWNNIFMKFHKLFKEMM